jgi:hypothetical protein
MSPRQKRSQTPALQARAEGPRGAGVDTNGGQTAWRRGLLRGMRAREVASGQARLTSLSITRIDTAADAPGCAVSSLCNNRAHPGGLEEGGAGTEAAAVRTARSAGISLHALEVRAYSKGRQSREVWAHCLG